jgi:hypothetical protein
VPDDYYSQFKQPLLRLPPGPLERAPKLLRLIAHALYLLLAIPLALIAFWVGTWGFAIEDGPEFGFVWAAVIWLGGLVGVKVLKYILVGRSSQNRPLRKSN